MNDNKYAKHLEAAVKQLADKQRHLRWTLKEDVAVDRGFPEYVFSLYCGATVYWPGEKNHRREDAALHTLRALLFKGLIPSPW